MAIDTNAPSITRVQIAPTAKSLLDTDNNNDVSQTELNIGFAKDMVKFDNSFGIKKNSTIVPTPQFASLGRSMAIKPGVTSRMNLVVGLVGGSLGHMATSLAVTSQRYFSTNPAMTTFSRAGFHYSKGDHANMLRVGGAVNLAMGGLHGYLAKQAFARGETKAAVSLTVATAGDAIGLVTKFIPKYQAIGSLVGNALSAGGSLAAHAFGFSD